MGTYEDNAERLLELAEAQFGELTEADRKLFRSVVDPDKWADYRFDDDKGTDPIGADEWSEKRRLRADRISWLCTDKDASTLVTHRGIQILGARIEGRLNLREASFYFAFPILESAIPDGLDIAFGHLKGLNLTGTHTGQIDGDGVRVDSDAFLRNGFHCDGGINLKCAIIGTDIDLSGASLSNESGPALTADGIKVRGGVFMHEGFVAKSEVSLLGASIGGVLYCRGGKFIDGSKNARVLCGDGMTVKGSIFMDEGFKAIGEVRLLGASIGGNLQCRGGRFDNAGGRAFSAEQIEVKGHVYLDDKACAIGAIDLAGAKITRALSLRSLDKDSKYMLRLDLAHVGIIRDDATGWPEKGRLHLHGFKYDSIDQTSPHDAKRRIEWIRRQPEDEFTPQPYEQLAGVLRKEGHEEDSKKVQVAKNWDYLWRRPRSGFWQKLRLDWIGRGFFGLSIGFGYRPWRALYWIGAFILIGWAVFGHGFNAGQLERTKAFLAKTSEAVSTTAEAPTRPKEMPFVYSIDVFVPLVNLHQAEYWQPDYGKSPGVCVYMWVHIIAGWVLTTLFVVGLTGKVRT